MDETQRAVERAVRSLAARAHSEKELVDKLVKADFDERTIAAAMAKLAAYHLIDDEAFATQWAATRARRGIGPRRISRELRDKGIDAALVESIVSAMDEEAMLEAATDLALKQLRKGGNNAYRRANDAIIRRGYDYDLARTALSEASRLHEEEHADDEPEEPDLEEEQALLEAAVEIALKRLGKEDKNARPNAYAALIRRGYGYDMAREALDEATRRLREDDD